MRLAIATCHPLPEDDVDQEPLSRALDAAGMTYEWIPWDAPRERFERADRVLIRSTWDYIHRLDAFLAWAEAMGPKLCNPAPVVRWNAHKGYLLELEARGVPVVPTVLVRRGRTTGSLADLLQDRGWNAAVVKPAVSAGSFSTRKIAGRVTPDDEAAFMSLVGERDVLVQPYVRSVETSGERSLVVIDGEVTHSVRKSPRFQGEDEAISQEAMPIADDEAALAEQAMAVARELTGTNELLYGRVDMARAEDGSPRLMELELIEPSLFFTRAPHALDRCIAALRRA